MEETVVPRRDDGLTAFLEVAFPAEPRYLSLARRIVTPIAAESGFTAEQAYEAALCLSEAFTNVIRHAQTSWATVRVAVDPLAMRIEVEDDGRGFNPRAAGAEEGFEGAEAAAALLSPGAGGEVRLGFRLIRQLMDRTEVESGTHGTVVRMTKFRRPEPVLAATRPRQMSWAARHIRRTIARYERDVALMSGAVAPQEDLDDLAILERFAASPDPTALLNDRKLRIKTLQATLDILREETDEADQ